MFKNLKVRDRILGGYSVPILLSLAVASLVYVNVRQVTSKIIEAKGDYLVLDETKDIVIALTNIQKTARGYIIAKNDVSLQEYQQNKEKIKSLIKSLDDLDYLITDPNQQDRLNEILELKDELENYNDNLIALVDNGRIDEAIKIWADGKGRVLGETLEQIIDDFEEREKEILDQKDKEHLVSLKFLNATVILGNLVSNILGIAIALWIAFSISKAVNRTVKQVVSSSAEIASTVEQQERTVSQQASSVNQTTTTMNELETSSVQSAEQAEASAELTREALSLAENGTQSVEQAMEGMTDLKEKVGAIAEQIMHLSEQTTQIGSISDLVGDIANQTNMLALNAAVEAVRAGEHGKGFSVVAAEIRKLADQSKKSADNINQLVTEIQAAINSTVMVTDEGTKTVNSSIILAEGTAEAFSGVTESIEQVFLRSQQISLTAKQQATSIEQVFGAMKELNLGAKENAIGMNQIKTSTEKLNEAAQGLNVMKAVV